MNYLWAFVIGGLLCVIGQLLIDYTKLTPARILVGYVVAGVILGGLGLYEPLQGNPRGRCAGRSARHPDRRTDIRCLRHHGSDAVRAACGDAVPRKRSDMSAVLQKRQKGDKCHNC